MHRSIAFVFAASLALSISAHAGQEMKTYKEVAVETPFDKGKCEFQLGVGAFTSFQSSNTERPKFTDLDLSLRWGTMLYTPSGDGPFRGNLEFLVEAFGAGLVEGVKTGYAGAALMLRYNFVQPDAKWVPYIQIQGGGVYNDVYKDNEQRVFGRSVEFDLGAGFGVRYLFNDHCALFAEADYRHVSSAGTSDRNLGLNSAGGFLGVSYLY
jgi:lipid A 3-O-deacylase